MGSDLLPEGWDLPRLLLAALTLSLLLTGVVAASTTTTAFGTYNRAWDGAADLRGVAGVTGAEPVTALNTSVYEEVTPNQTVAVVLSPDKRYTPSEAARVRRFVEAGGTLVVAEDFGPNGNPLLEAVGADSRVDGAPLRDERRYYRSPDFPVAPNVSEAPETDGVEQLTLNHASAVLVDGADTAEDTDPTVLVRSSEFSYLDSDGDGELDENASLSRRPVVVREPVGKGTVYAVSDPSMFINAMLDRPDNRRFARNLFAPADTVLVDVSHQSGQPPLAIALVWLRRTPLLQVLLGLVGVGVVGYWPSLRRVVERASDRVGRDHPSVTDDSDTGAIAAYLNRQHPEWDADRIRRVMTGVKPPADNGDDDD